MEALWRKTLPYSLLLIFAIAAGGVHGDGKVQLVLYYETLCPYCSNFIVNSLNQIFENGLISITDLRLVPYGNARIGANNTISCQRLREITGKGNLCTEQFREVRFQLVADIGIGHMVTGYSSTLPDSSALVIDDICSLLLCLAAKIAVKRDSTPNSSSSMASMFLSLLLLFSCFSSSFSETISLPSDSGKVSLSLYYESLCPYSAQFIVDGLAKLFESNLISFVDLRLVPWGNAKISSGNNTFQCQHGSTECLLNTVEACAIDTWPNLSDHFRVIYCIENMVYKHEYPQWESCFDQLGLESKPVLDCYTGGRGKELELGYAEETGALEPPHQYVPWVTVNGTPLYEDYEDFIRYICAAYKGVSAPETCSKLSIKSVTDPKKKNTPKTKVCNKTKSAPSFLRKTVDSVMGWMNVLG